MKCLQTKIRSTVGFDHVELAVFFLVLVAELGLFVGEVDGSALDPGLGDDGGGLEDVAIGDEEGGVLA